MSTEPRCRHPIDAFDYDAGTCLDCGATGLDPHDRDDRTPADHYMDARKAAREEPQP